MAGQTVPNLTVSTLSGTGSISIYNHAGNDAVIVGTFGY
jgi:N-acetylglucosamine kinase-like BadF-type ATPase